MSKRKPNSSPTAEISSTNGKQISPFRLNHTSTFEPSSNCKWVQTIHMDHTISLQGIYSCTWRNPWCDLSEASMLMVMGLFMVNVESYSVRGNFQRLLWFISTWGARESHGMVRTMQHIVRQGRVWTVCEKLWSTAVKMWWPEKRLDMWYMGNDWPVIGRRMVGGHLQSQEWRHVASLDIFRRPICWIINYIDPNLSIS